MLLCCWGFRSSSCRELLLGPRGAAAPLCLAKEKRLLQEPRKGNVSPRTHRLRLSFPTVEPLWYPGQINRVRKRGGLSPIKVSREAAAELSHGCWSLERRWIVVTCEAGIGGSDTATQFFSPFWTCSFSDCLHHHLLSVRLDPSCPILPGLHKQEHPWLFVACDWLSSHQLVMKQSLWKFLLFLHAYFSS